MNSIKYDFEYAIDVIANNHGDKAMCTSTAQLYKDVIIEAHKKLRGSDFWGYIDENNISRSLIEQILQKKK